MADVHDERTRKYNMSRIRSKDTKPELLVRRYLFSKGFRYRLHDKRLPAKPDLVLPKFKTVIQVQGCFWHQHENCRYASIPKTRTSWWNEKLERNVARDAENHKELKKLGWKVLVIWECELKKDCREKNLENLLDKI